MNQPTGPVCEHYGAPADYDSRLCAACVVGKRLLKGATVSKSDVERAGAQLRRTYAARRRAAMRYGLLHAPLILARALAYWFAKL